MAEGDPEDEGMMCVEGDEVGRRDMTDQEVQAAAVPSSMSFSQGNQHHTGITPRVALAEVTHKIFFF